MKKIYSVFIYVFLSGFPVMIVSSAYVLIHENKITTDLIAPNIMFVLIPLIFYLFVMIKYKRIYYNEEYLFVFELFSNKSTILPKEDVISVYQWYKTDPFNYKIGFYDKNGKVKVVYFLKDFFLFKTDLNKYLGIKQ